MSIEIIGLLVLIPILAWLDTHFIGKKYIEYILKNRSIKTKIIYVYYFAQTFVEIFLFLSGVYVGITVL